MKYKYTMCIYKCT